MKLRSFRIRNFRSIEDTGQTECRNLMVFIGRNNAGKSNILKALDILFNDAKPSSNDIPFFVNDNDSIEITAKFDTIRRDVERAFNIHDDTLTYSKIFPIINEGNISVGSAQERINKQNITTFESSRFATSTEIRTYLKDNLPKYYYIPAPGNLTDPEKLNIGSLIQEFLLPVLDDKYIDDGHSIVDHLELIKSILETRVKSIETNISQILSSKIDDFEDLSVNIPNINLKKVLDPTLMIKTTSTGIPLSALLQGAGTQSFIILALAQHYAKDSIPINQIIAFEEPEIALHYSAQRNMLDMINQITKNNRHQVFITTHSTIFIDHSVDNIYLVSKRKGKTAINIPQKTSKIISQLGIRGSDYLLSDAIIFVEGIADYEVFRTWTEAKAPPRWNNYLITFVPLGGLPSLRFFRKEDFTHLTKRVYTILDSDKKFPEDKISFGTQEIVKKINELEGLPKILQRRSLENFFTERAATAWWPNTEEVVKSELFEDHYADMKSHLTEIKQEYFRVLGSPNYKEKSYNSGDAKQIAQNMVEFDEVPKEFIRILEDIIKDLYVKL
ncbi:MAG: ATP-dependent endonuclease [Promethearchaeota archaeon]